MRFAPAQGGTRSFSPRDTVAPTNSKVLFYRAYDGFVSALAVNREGRYPKPGEGWVNPGWSEVTSV